MQSVEALIITDNEWCLCNTTRWHYICFCMLGELCFHSMERDH